MGAGGARLSTMTVLASGIVEDEVARLLHLGLRSREARLDAVDLFRPRRHARALLSDTDDDTYGYKSY